MHDTEAGIASSTAAAAETPLENEADIDKNRRQGTRNNRAEREELALIEKRLNCEAELKIKLLLVGSSAVGKTSLISRLSDSQASIETLKPTMVGNFHHTVVKFGGKCAHVRVWDMGGAEQFHQSDLLADFYRDIDGAMLVFAMDNFESFTQLPVWLERIQRHQARPLDQLDCCLVANKSDRAAARMVSTREAEVFARQHGLPYTEASALAVDNVQKAFYDLVLAVDKRRETTSHAASAAAASGAVGRSGRRPAGVATAGFVDAMALCCGCGGRAAAVDRG